MDNEKYMEDRLTDLFLLCLMSLVATVVVYYATGSNFYPGLYSIVFFVMTCIVSYLIWWAWMQNSHGDSPSRWILAPFLLAGTYLSFVPLIINYAGGSYTWYSNVAVEYIITLGIFISSNMLVHAKYIINPERILY